MWRDWRLFVPKTVTVLRQGYRLTDLRWDALAGLTVAIVALPLAMALAIASGAPPETGLVTAVIAGFLISLLGGSRFQIGGPTGAFVVIVYGVIAHHGYDGLLMATLMAGAIVLVAGLLRIGDLIKYMPDPVTTGFTTGIAVIILTSQLADLFGLSAGKVPAEFIPKLEALWQARGTLSLQALGLAAGCLAALVLLNRYAPKVPRFLVVTVLAAIGVTLFKLPVETIGTRFGEVHAGLPAPNLAFWSWDKAQAVLPSALTIALLAGVESLLSAVVADQMTGRRHRSNMELVGQGIANIASALFGGLPATGALARTATNIRAGARSPVAGMLHAVFLLVFMLLAGGLMKFVPLAALAAILVIVAVNMAELHRFTALLKTTNGDRAVLVITFLLTVLVDLTVAIEVGVVLAALVFMHRMARLTTVEGGGALDDEAEGDTPPDEGAYAPNMGLPRDTVVLTFRGPLFFGSASVLKDALERIDSRKDRYILRLDDTAMIDPTGAYALASFLRRVLGEGSQVVITGARRAVIRSLLRDVDRATLRRVRFAASFDKVRAEILDKAKPAGREDPPALKTV